MEFNNLSPVARFFGQVFAFLFILSAVTALFAATADGRLFRPDLYQNALEEQHFYTLFPSLLAEQVAGKANLKQFRNGEQLKYLDQTTYVQLFQQMFPPDWVKAQTIQVTNGIFDYLNLKTPVLKMPVSMAEVKQRMRGEPGKQMGLRVLSTWPKCNVDQLAAWAELGLKGQLEGFPVCQPPEGALNLLSPVIQFSMEQWSNTFPDQIDLENFLPGFSPSRTGPSGGYQAVRWLMRLSPFAALFFLALITLTAVRKMRDLLLWWGIPFAVSGLSGLVLSLLAGLPFIHWILNNTAVTVSGNMTQTIVAVVFGAVDFVARDYLIWVGIESAVVAVIGLGLVGYYFLIRRPAQVPGPIEYGSQVNPWDTDHMD